MVGSMRGMQHILDPTKTRLVARLLEPIHCSFNGRVLEAFWYHVLKAFVGLISY